MDNLTSVHSPCGKNGVLDSPFRSQPNTTISKLDIDKRFIARQPILDRHENTVAYELLYRSGWENFFSHHDLDEASAQTLHDSLLEFGLDALVGSKKAYLNITRRTPGDRSVHNNKLQRSLEPDA